MDDRQIAGLIDELAEEMASLRRKPVTSPFNLKAHSLDQGTVSSFFDPRMAFELALGVFDPIEIAARYDLTHEQFQLLTESDPFQRMLAAYQTEIQEKGVSTRLKAKLQLDHLLGVAFDMATDPAVPANVRADIIKWHADLADEMPKKQTAVMDGSGGAPHFTYALHIVMGGDAPEGRVYEAAKDEILDVTPVSSLEIPLVFSGVPEEEKKAHAPATAEAAVEAPVAKSGIEAILEKIEAQQAVDREKALAKNAREAEAALAPPEIPEVVPVTRKTEDLEAEAIKRRAAKMAKQLKETPVRANKKFGVAAEDTFDVPAGRKP